MPNRKCYKAYGKYIEESIYYIDYLLKTSNSNGCEKNAALHILETNIKAICDNDGDVFTEGEIVTLRGKLSNVLECEVNSKFNRELDSLLNKLTAMYKKIPFIYHGVMFGRFKMSVLSCLIVCVVAISSAILIKIFI